MMNESDSGIMDKYKSCFLKWCLMNLHVCGYRYLNIGKRWTSEKLYDFTCDVSHSMSVDVK